ncbi:SHD1 domain-containing protein [Blastopirellula retiformator]|uniref:SLA1 homology domain-containing protein n=1 Tax=Blastopirellula retiformator TaxID=2527970 RepID=A0A5C5V0T0_9BACT|nr:SHD1 domain-containing protein [Blastopirellula retiformator]TWT31397.1 hypothetical protein Enr8_33180 [Blastopirellula retiformator]
MMVDWMPLLAAGDEAGKGPALLIFFALGIIFFLLGVYSIVTKTVLLRARDRWIFAMFGWTEFSDSFAVFTGACYCLGGVLFVVTAIAVSMGFNLEAQLNGQGNQVANQQVAVQQPQGNKPNRPAVEKAAPPQPSQPVMGETPEEKAAREEEDRQRKAEFDARMRKMEEDDQRREQERADREAAEMERKRQAEEAERKRQQELEAARKAALTLPEPPQALPVFTYVAGTVQEGTLLGRVKGERFMDHAPEGGVMVGAIFFIDDHFGTSVAGVQPIYQVGDKYVKGAVCGTETDQPVQQLAEPGGVVAGVKTRIGLIMDRAQLAYGPLKGTRIDPNQGYFGLAVGQDGGSPKDFYADGKAIGGIFGSYEPGKSLTSLGMYVIPRMQASAMPAAPAAAEMRTFTSADGKFRIEAKLQKVNDDGTVTLLKKEGGEISVPLTSLSEEDRKYVNSRK